MQEVVVVKGNSATGTTAEVVQNTISDRNEQGWRLVSSYVESYREHCIGGRVHGSHASEVILIFEKFDPTALISTPQKSYREGRSGGGVTM